MSKVEAHTPGPWNAVNNPTSNYGLEVIADVKTKARRVVCRVSGPDREANANLLAAAPELLAFAQSIVEAESEGHMMRKWMANDARAVIAKATGAA